MKPPPQPSIQPLPSEVEQELAAGIAEWPEWTVPVHLMMPRQENEDMPGDPSFRVRVQ